ncbi:E3 ubiquitin-protein ligase [Canna indica]|uniref:E3 ubiquitin-protein ligase n=1 Tax=Canna indica TaxID=4628 RepID=A0AAQ3Q0T6_9LILI|nr:E3 ubiquitin-protein ligase [Canna indica]
MPPPGEGSNDGGARAVPLAFLMRMAIRISRARWFSFLRRVFRYQNGSRSDLVANPFNSRPWLAMELTALLSQIVIITVTMATSRKENPVWPLRIWISGYNLGNLLSLPLLYWRYRHGSALGSDIEQINRNVDIDASGASSYLMNKSRTFLELFFAIWFVMGNVWIFDSRHGSFDRAPQLHVLCIVILAWNAILYSFPFLLFLLLCCCVPLISNLLGYNMNLASADRGATEDQISRLSRFRFKEVRQTRDLANENQDCCICLARYSDKEEVRQLPCLHMFHLNCVDQWLKIMSSCPLCKQELEK